MIDTVLFDLDNTILDFNKAEQAALQKTLPALGIEPTPAVLQRYSQLNLAQWKLLEQGKTTRERLKIRRYELLFEELGVSRSPQEATALYEEWLGHGYFFMDGAQEMLQSLAGRYRLYIVTNGPAKNQTKRIRGAGLTQYFDGVFISEAIGYNKPDRAFFAYCFRHIPDFQAESTVLIGDSLTSDILGGKNAGLKTIWYNPAEAPESAEIRPDYEIRSLAEVAPLLQRL